MLRKNKGILHLVNFTWNIKVCIRFVKFNEELTLNWKDFILYKIKRFLSPCTQHVLYKKVPKVHVGMLNLRRNKDQGG